MTFINEHYYDWLLESEEVVAFPAIHEKDDFAFLQEERVEEIITLRDALSVKLIALIRMYGDHEIIQAERMLQQEFFGILGKALTRSERMNTTKNWNDIEAFQQCLDVLKTDFDTHELLFMLQYISWTKILMRCEGCIENIKKEQIRAATFFARYYEIIKKYEQNDPEGVLLQ